MPDEDGFPTQKELDAFSRGTRKVVITLDEMEELLEGACKFKRGSIRGHWAFFLHPSKGDCHFLTGWCVKEKGKDVYNYHLDGCRKLMPYDEDTYKEGDIHTEYFATHYLLSKKGDTAGEYLIKDAERGKALQKKIRDLPKVRTYEEAEAIWEKTST